MFSRKSAWRNGSCSGAGRNPKLRAVDGRGDRNSATAVDYSGRTTCNHAIHRLRETGQSDRPKIPRVPHETHFRFASVAASLRRFALAQNSAGKTTSRKSDAQNRASPGDQEVEWLRS